MNLIQEIESARKRVLQEVNLEFDRLVEQALAEFPQGTPSKKAVCYDIQYPLIAGTKIFKGTKPTKVVFPNRTEVVAGTWKQVAQIIMERCLAEGNERILRSLAGNISGRKRLLLAKTDANMHSPIKLAEGLYMEAHYDTETLLNVLTHRILDAIQYDYSGIQVAIRK